MDFGIFDADQHYYEAEDCLTRHATDRMRAMKAVRWITEMDGKRKRLVIDYDGSQSSHSGSLGVMGTVIAALKPPSRFLPLTSLAWSP